MEVLNLKIPYFYIMDIQAEKNALIEFISSVKDAQVIEKIRQFVKANENDFWNDLSDIEKQEIEKGIEQLDRGENFNYKDVMKAYRK